SKCGKAAASSSREGGTAFAVCPASVGIETSASRHFGQSPCGASGGIGPPHFGQRCCSDAILIPLSEEAGPKGYAESGATNRRSIAKCCITPLDHRDVGFKTVLCVTQL